MCMDLGSLVVGILVSITRHQGSRRDPTVGDLLRGIGSSNVKGGWESLRFTGR